MSFFEADWIKILFSASGTSATGGAITPYLIVELIV